MEVTIDRSGCIGCGQCVAACPDVFELASDGLAQVIRQPDASNEGEARVAAEACPVSVIYLGEE